MIYELNSQTELTLQPRSELEEILQNVRMIIGTVKGTVPLDREFGISAEILDAPINQQSRLIGEIAEAIEKFEPRARLRNIHFNADSNGQLQTSLSLDIAEDFLNS